MNNSEEASLEARKKAVKRNKSGRTAGSIGGIFYLIEGIVFLNLGIYFINTGGWFLGVNSMAAAVAFSIPILIAGALSVAGSIIGKNRVQIGGITLLSSVPLAILFHFFNGIWFDMGLEASVFILMPFPIPHSLLVLIGAILLLASKSQGAKSGNK